MNSDVNEKYPIFDELISVFRNVNSFHPLTFKMTVPGFAGSSRLKVENTSFGHSYFPARKKSRKTVPNVGGKVDTLNVHKNTASLLINVSNIRHQFANLKELTKSSRDKSHVGTKYIRQRGTPSLIRENFEVG